METINSATVTLDWGPAVSSTTSSGACNGSELSNSLNGSCSQDARASSVSKPTGWFMILNLNVFSASLSSFRAASAYVRCNGKKFPGTSGSGINWPRPLLTFKTQAVAGSSIRAPTMSASLMRFRLSAANRISPGAFGGSAGCTQKPTRFESSTPSALSLRPSFNGAGGGETPGSGCRFSLAPGSPISVFSNGTASFTFCV